MRPKQSPANRTSPAGSRTPFAASRRSVVQTRPNSPSVHRNRMVQIECSTHHIRGHSNPTTYKAQRGAADFLEARAPMEQQPSEVTLPQAIRAGPRREFQSPIRGRGLRRATSVQTPIAVRAKLPAGRHAPLRGRPLCPRQTLYTILRPHAASCCSLRVRAPAPPGWKLPWNNNPRKLPSAGTSGGTAARISVSHTGFADCAAPPVSKRRLRSGPNSQPGDTHHCADGLFARDKHLVHDSANACSLVLFLARPRAGRPRGGNSQGSVARRNRSALHSGRFPQPLTDKTRLHEQHTRQPGPGRRDRLRARHATSCAGSPRARSARRSSCAGSSPASRR